MAAEEGAALVARTVEVHVAVAHVGLHLAEEGRQDLILVLLGGGVDQAAVEADVVGLGVDDGDDLAEKLRRQLCAVVEQNDGNPERRRLDAFELARERLVGGHHDGRDAREVGLVEVDDDAFGLEGVQRAGRRCNVVSAHVGLRTGGKDVCGRSALLEGGQKRRRRGIPICVNHISKRRRRTFVSSLVAKGKTGGGKGAGCGGARRA